MAAFDLDEAVRDFLAGASTGTHYPPRWFDRLDLEQAARVQLGVLDAKVSGGLTQAGWKVGLTAKAIQEQFNVHEPVFGYLLEEGLIRSGAELKTARLLSPGFENEICVQLGDDLKGPGVTPQRAASAIASLFPAMEIIETRGDLTAQLAVAIADNVQQKGFVLGEPRRYEPDLDLSRVRAEVWINDRRVAEGLGEAVLGNPLNSVAWLANRLAEFGRHLQAGDYIMAGSLTRQFPLRAGDDVVARFEPLGDVGVRMSGG